LRRCGGRILDAIVLAGGFGTRLQSVVPSVPKPMAPVNKKPFLEYVIDWLDRQKITNVILAVGYKADIIKDYFNDRIIRYSFEDEPLGTGGAIKKALSLCTSNYVVVVNGDTLFCVDLNVELNSDLTMFCRYVENADRYGLVAVENGVVTSLSEKKQNSLGYINGGVYIMKRGLLSDYPDKFSFETDALPKLAENRKVDGIISDSYFIDIGTPEDYERARNELELCQTTSWLRKAIFSKLDAH
jgi:D-glycero-alpha-D-manno-heptose 1-phosphate guanylyltransferase